jgi:hypothetical protein
MKRNSRNPRRPKNGVAHRIVATQGDTAAYRGQPVVIMDIPATPLLVTTSAAGAAAFVYAPDPVTNVANWTARFSRTFDEYRIRAVSFEVVSTSLVPAVAPVDCGSSLFFLDEDTLVVPAPADALSRVGRLVPNNSSNHRSCFTETWTARDLKDLDYTLIGTSSTPIALQCYTDAANFGCDLVSANIFVVRPILTIEFRGLNA